MEAAWEPTPSARASTRLLEDFAALERLDHTRLPARDRLQRALGGELAGLLLRALAGNHRGRSGRPA
jgi:hypothetical protein